MSGRRRAGVVAGVAALGTAAAAAIVVLWDPAAKYEPVANTAASTISEEHLARVAEQRWFFAHRSVGGNILAGISDVFSARGVQPPPVREVAPGTAPVSSAGGGELVHAQIGRNGAPLEKLRNFDALLRAGLGDTIDVALLKFCYEDVTAETDVDALFRSYSGTLAALERDFPKVTFLHSTAPLRTGSGGIKGAVKVLLGRDDNVARERYNALVRQAFGPDRLFDLAMLEATAPDGERLSSLYPGYTSDGGHLNAAGSSLAAATLLRLVADASTPG